MPADYLTVPTGAVIGGNGDGPGTPNTVPDGGGPAGASGAVVGPVTAPRVRSSCSRLDPQGRSVGGVGQRLGALNQAPPVQRQQALVERLHLVVLTLAHDALDAVGLPFEHRFARGVVHHEYLDGRDAAAATGAGQQALTNDAPQRSGEQSTNLGALVRREQLDELRHGARHADRRHAREHEVPDVSRLDRGARGRPRPEAHSRRGRQGLGAVRG